MDERIDAGNLFMDEGLVRKSSKMTEVIERREKMKVKKVMLGEEHREQVKQIYETIMPVKFRWGGSGFIKVRASSFFG